MNNFEKKINKEMNIGELKTAIIEAKKEGLKDTEILNIINDNLIIDGIKLKRI